MDLGVLLRGLRRECPQISAGTGTEALGLGDGEPGQEASHVSPGGHETKGQGCEEAAKICHRYRFSGVRLPGRDLHGGERYVQ